MSWKEESLSIDVPESYVGTSGQLALAFYSISDADEWTTDISISAMDVDGDEIGAALITDAPFIRNRSTEYSGSLFNGSNSFSVSLNTDWEESYTDTW